MTFHSIEKLSFFLTFSKWKDLLFHLAFYFLFFYFFDTCCNYYQKQRSANLCATWTSWSQTFQKASDIQLEKSEKQKAECVAMCFEQDMFQLSCLCLTQTLSVCLFAMMRKAVCHASTLLHNHVCEKRKWKRLSAFQKTEVLREIWNSAPSEKKICHCCSVFISLSSVLSAENRQTL